MRPKRFRSLASKLVLVGLVQLVLLGVTGMVISILQGPRDEAHPREVLDAKTLAKLEALADRPAELTAALEELEERRVEISIYDNDKQLVASSVDPPLAIPERRRRPSQPRGEGPPPRPADLPQPPPDIQRTGRRAMVIGFHMPAAERGYLVARGVHSKPSFVTGPLLALICGFTIMVIGALLTARWIVQPIDRLSRTARALGAGELSARSRLDRSDEIGELGHRIDEMADRIERLLVTEKELLANVAHELRTPLTRIGVALDLAGEGDSEAARASLAEIAIDIAELETIVDDILTAMRFEVASSEFPLKRAVLPPAEIADAAASRLRARHPSRPFVTNVARDLPAIHVDRVLFRRVIDNLLENAHKYSPDGRAPLSLEVACDAKRVVFEVRDKGIGILTDDLPKVFTAFFRGDKSRSRETGGVGLGLTLAKRIVEAHGGTIEITSKPGEGTNVRVAVPAVD
ncbi:MAG: HAMP domain-containing histidine kinase [Myxococcota bacterium]|nr:HAMP domain-containing histidine kinase [Myxococcota bacterium]